MAQKVEVANLCALRKSSKMVWQQILWVVEKMLCLGLQLTVVCVKVGPFNGFEKFYVDWVAKGKLELVGIGGVCRDDKV